MNVHRRLTGSLTGAKAARSRHLFGSFLQHPNQRIQPAPLLDGLGREPAVLVVAVRLPPWCAR